MFDFLTPLFTFVELGLHAYCAAASLYFPQAKLDLISSVSWERFVLVLQESQLCKFLPNSKFSASHVDSLKLIMVGMFTLLLWKPVNAVTHSVIFELQGMMRDTNFSRTPLFYLLRTGRQMSMLNYIYTLLTLHFRNVLYPVKLFYVNLICLDCILLIFCFRF